MDLIPIQKFKKVSLALTLENDWVLLKNDKTYLLSSKIHLIVWLPLLEIDLDNLLKRINETLELKRINIDFFKTFPLSNLISTGLNSESIHWIDCSLNWLKHPSLKITNQIEESLKKLLDSGKIKKPTKDRIYRILKKLSSNDFNS